MEKKINKLLTIENLDAFYGKKQIVYSASTEYEEGDIVLLVGPNGAGKSTFLKAVSGVIKSKKGRILFNGENIIDIPIEEKVKKGIVYLLQTENIFSNYTVYDNLQIAGYFLKKNEFNKMIEKVFMLFPNLYNKKNQLAGLLSGGERQALAISMVLMKKPKVLLLDEPLAGLAPKTANELISFLSQIYSIFDVKMICFVEHKIELSLEYANRVQVLVQGKIKLDKRLNGKTDKKILLEEIEDVYFGDNTNLKGAE